MALTPHERIELRGVETRLALETARRRCRMYLAAPELDPKTPEQVLLEVLSLLEAAPAPRAAHHETAETQIDLTEDRASA